MNVQSFNPNETSRAVNLSFSEKAQKHIEKELAKRNALGLRLSVEKSGCSGLRYRLGFAEESNQQDTKVLIDDKFTVFIGEDVQAYVNGIHVDFVTEGLNSSFQFSNPNASGTCGCGESFAV